MLNKKFVHVLNNFKIYKTAHKNSQTMYSPEQNKKAVCMAAAYFKVSIPGKGHRDSLGLKEQPSI